MLDIQFIRENPELVQEKSKQKGYDIDIQQLLGFDEKRRELQQQVDGLRQERNEIADSMKGGRPSDELIAKGRAVKDKLADLEHQFASIDKEFTELLKAVPNMPLEDVPVGGEEDSLEIKKVGEQKTGARDHLDIATERSWVDFERGAKVAGTKFY